MSGGSSCTFIIVGKQDNPLYELDFGQKRDSSSHLSQFVIHAALDLVDEAVWNTTQPYLKVVDKFNDMVVSAYMTAGFIKFMLLHEGRAEEAIRGFFQDVCELYVKVQMNPFYETNQRITSPMFDQRVRALVKKYF
eukprot:TRINITY_DN1541_c0_g1_i1.p2 TRINITY_DN1541_c0_g1~~TRINITY_DN1541_c0_g1_i1.p2  ORF type:complete len:136 (+),score=24.14 TRINITY_DN1541_c0_g1_i1:49-456(+)